MRKTHCARLRQQIESEGLAVLAQYQRLRQPYHTAMNQKSLFETEENGVAPNEGGSRNSKLIFLTSQAPAESDDLGQIKRVREPVSRSKGGVQGKVADVLFGRSRHAESLNELKGFRVLLASGRADLWQEQPFVLEYYDHATKHRYVPDILVVWGAHREVVEIKEDFEADLSENQRHFALIREFLSDYSYHFRVWKKSEICAEPRLANVGLILRYRGADVSRIERERIRQGFCFVSEIPLRAFSETHSISVQSMLRIVLEGTLHVNWWQPLTLDSIVSVTPIGPQVWPFRPFHGETGFSRSSISHGYPIVA